MKLYIQTSAPQTTEIYDGEDETIGEALETIFPLFTEDAILFWNHIAIPLSYKYDISVMFADILALVAKVAELNSGTSEIYWPSDTFACKWRVRWSQKEVRIDCIEWASVTGGLESTLAESGIVECTRDQFLAEWKRLFEVIERALAESGYHAQQLPEMTQLSMLKNKISGSGVLYG